MEAAGQTSNWWSATSPSTTTCTAATWSGSRWWRSTARRPSSSSWTRGSCGNGSVEWIGHERRRLPDRHGGGPPVQRAPLVGCGGAAVALSAGAHAGPEDGQGDDLLPG